MSPPTPDRDGPPTSAMGHADGIARVFAGIPVADYDTALTWYERFLGQLSDVSVTDNEAMWQVTEAGWIYVVGDYTRPGLAR